MHKDTALYTKPVARVVASVAGALSQGLFHELFLWWLLESGRVTAALDMTAVEAILEMLPHFEPNHFCASINFSFCLRLATWGNLPVTQRKVECPEPQLTLRDASVVSFVGTD